MKILILDDDIERWDVVTERLKDSVDEIKWVFTAGDCIDLLCNESWDVLFLDHDLGDDNETGYDVACWLEARPSKQPKKIYIHSLNPMGASRMRQAITKSYCEPGIIFKLGLDENKHVCIRMYDINYKFD